MWKFECAQKAKRIVTKKAKKVRRADTKPLDEAVAEPVPPQKVEMPKIEPPPKIEFDMDGSARWLKRMDPGRAEFLCTIEWSETPVNERMESYYLQQSRTHWILWIRQYDDNWGKWEKPLAIARCPWKGFAAGDAAMTLLAAVLREGQRLYQSGWGPFDINNTGMLSTEELNAVANAVLGEGEKGGEQNEAQTIEWQQASAHTLAKGGVFAVADRRYTQLSGIRKPARRRMLAPDVEALLEAEGFASSTRLSSSGISRLRAAQMHRCDGNYTFKIAP
jgi:hypothetical protein